MNLGDDHSADDVLKEHLLGLLRRYNNITRVAKTIGWSRPTVYNRIDEWGLKLEWKNPNPPESNPPPAS